MSYEKTIKFYRGISLVYSAFNPNRKRSKTHQKLQAIHKLIDWESLEKLFKGIDKTQQGKGGRPPIALSSHSLIHQNQNPVFTTPLPHE